MLEIVRGSGCDVRGAVRGSWFVVRRSLNGERRTSNSGPDRRTSHAAPRTFAFVGFLLCAACATNPATGKHEISLMSVDQEIAIGEQQDGLVRKEMGVYADAALQEYISGIGMRLAANSDRPNLPWHFTVVDTPAVNAFALPGGYIYITRGILPYLQDEAQLAGVLGHEIGHVTARHAAQQYSRSIGAELGLLAGAI